MDTRSFSLTQGGTAQCSPGAEAGDCLGRPVTLLRPLSLVDLHWTVSQDPETMETESDKAGTGCLGVRGDWSVLGPTWRNSQRLVRGQEQGPQEVLTSLPS